MTVVARRAGRERRGPWSARTGWPVLRDRGSGTGAGWCQPGRVAPQLMQWSSVD
jgi:hypothetical protein